MGREWLSPTRVTLTLLEGLIAQTYEKRGDHRKALEHYISMEKRRLLSIDVHFQSDPSNLSDPAMPWNDVASMYANANDIRSAVEFYRNTLEMWFEHPNIQRPDVVLTYCQISQIFEKENFYNNAMFVWKKAADVAEEASPQDLSSIDRYLRQYDQALRMYSSGDPGSLSMNTVPDDRYNKHLTGHLSIHFKPSRVWYTEELRQISAQ